MKMGLACPFLFFLLSLSASTEMYSSDPLRPNDFHLDQMFIIKNPPLRIDIKSLKPECFVENQGPNDYLVRCGQAGNHIITIGTQNYQFQILEEKRRYRWSFAIVSAETNKVTEFIETGKTYHLRIWITELSFDQNIQNELLGIAETISIESAGITKSFYTLGEFPVVSFKRFDSFNVETQYVNAGDSSYWQATFNVSDIFMRSFKILGHENSDFFGSVSQIDYNFQYKSVISENSEFFTSNDDSKFTNIPQDSKINIQKIPCYPNYAIAKCKKDNEETKYYFTNDNFQSVKEFGNKKNYSDVYLTLNGIYYVEDKKVKRTDLPNTILFTFPSDDDPVGFFSSEYCDYFFRTENKLSLENEFIGIFSRSKVAISTDGLNFKTNILLNFMNLTFLSASYQWQQVSVLAQTASASPYVLSFDILHNVYFQANLQSSLSSGFIKFGSEYGLFACGANLFFSPDFKSSIALFLPGGFQSNTNKLVSNIVQIGNRFIAVSEESIYCGEYQAFNAVQLFNNPINGGFLMLNSQQNLVSVGPDTTNNKKFISKPIMNYIPKTIRSFSKDVRNIGKNKNDLDPLYFDTSSVINSSLSIASVTNDQSSIQIKSPSSITLRTTLVSKSVSCSSLVTYVNRRTAVTSDIKASSELCQIYHVNLQGSHISSPFFRNDSSRQSGIGSSRIQIFMYTNGIVYDVYNIPVIIGCPLRRRLGLRIDKTVCYPSQICKINLFYKRQFKPVPLLFDDDKYVKEVEGDFVLIANANMKYEMTVRDAKCLTKPQTFSEMGKNWSNLNYLNCFRGDSESLDDNSKSEYYPILNISHNFVTIDDNSEYVDIRLLNLGSESTMCQLDYNFTVHVIERPLNFVFIIIIVIVAIIVIVNAIIYEYWRYNSFKFAEARFMANDLNSSSIEDYYAEDEDSEGKKQKFENQPISSENSKSSHRRSSSDSQESLDSIGSASKSKNDKNTVVTNQKTELDNDDYSYTYVDEEVEIIYEEEEEEEEEEKSEGL